MFFLLCYLGCINKIYCIRLNLYNYLIHPDSLMAASKKDQPGNLDKVNNLSYALDIFYKSIQPFSNITHFYPAIHFNFLKQHINALYELGWSSKDICKFIRSELYNSQFCLNEFRLFVKHSKEYYFMLGKSSVLEDKRILKYYCDANWMKFRIESKIFDLYKKIRDGVRHIGNSNYNIL